MSASDSLRTAAGTIEKLCERNQRVIIIHGFVRLRRHLDFNVINLTEKRDLKTLGKETRHANFKKSEKVSHI